MFHRQFKHFKSANSLMPYNNALRWVPLVFELYRWGNRSTERLSNWPRVTQLGDGRARIPISAAHALRHCPASLKGRYSLYLLMLSVEPCTQQAPQVYAVTSVTSYPLPSSCLPHILAILFFFFFFLSVCGCLSSAPYWGPGLQPSPVPWVGIQPVTLLLAVRHSIHWATPARAHTRYS